MRPPATTPGALQALQADLLLRRAEGGDQDVLRRVVLALGAARDDGHVCLDLDAWASATDDDGAPRPDAESIVAALRASGLVVEHGMDAQPSTIRPLVLDPRRRLYALRHFVAERAIAGFVQQRLARPPLLDGAALAATLRSLDLQPTAGDEPDWQLAAVAAAAAQPFAVICGGPGTGKTTTVARILAALLHETPELRIAIAAPTGKAAARLAEALQQQAAQRPALAAALRDLEPRTLHRLLGYLGLDDAFRHGRDRRLPHDLVVVDEASMVDPSLFAQLCAALRDDARLLLVGDNDQLAAVSAGQVLGDLCRSASPQRGVGPRLAALVAAATGMRLPTQVDAAPIADATVMLQRNFRFGRQPGIGGFATGLMRRDPAAALASLDAGHDDLRLEPDAERALALVLDALAAQRDAAADGDAEQALAALTEARVLTAQRHGPTGAGAWNRRIEQALAARGHRVDDPYYVGRPVLVTENDHQNRIWNGDLGVVGRDAKGHVVVWFRDADGRPRPLHPRRLPAHETAWATTVHKAQGSEFDDVLLVLPDRPGPLLHASLIYTGVTRARRRAILCAGRDLLAPALSLWPTRTSGLADALGPTPATG